MDEVGTRSKVGVVLLTVVGLGLVLLSVPVREGSLVVLSLLWLVPDSMLNTLLFSSRRSLEDSIFIETRDNFWNGAQDFR